MRAPPGEVFALVLGGGPAGIAAALALGDEALLLERGTAVGGLSATLSFAGAVFDLGGHSFHTPHPHVRELVFSALEMYEQERDARCWWQGEWVPYPFQKHFHLLRCARTREACARGPTSPGAGDAADFEDYLQARFGDGLARHFMLPYNRKLWGEDLRRLSATWVSERIAAPGAPRESFAETGGQRTPLQPGTRVAYPARGGFGEIFRALGARVRKARCGVEIVAIDPLRRRARAVDGEIYRYRTLLSTLPLPRLLALVAGVPDDLIRAAADLEALALDLALIAIDEPVPTPIQRVYASEPRVAAHKIALNHNSSAYLRGLPVHGVMAEISRLRSRGAEGRDLLRWVVDDLVALGLLHDRALIREARLVHLPLAYPVPTHARSAIVARIRAWLAEHAIHTVGRFGEWDYINADEALFRGLALGEHLRAAA